MVIRNTGVSPASQSRAIEEYRLAAVTIFKHCATFTPVSAASFPDSYFLGTVFILLSCLLYTATRGIVRYILKGALCPSPGIVADALNFLLMVSICALNCLVSAVINRQILGPKYLIGRNFLLFSTTLLYMFVRAFVLLLDGGNSLLFHMIYFGAISCLANYYVQGCLREAGEFDELDNDTRFKVRLLIFIEILVILHTHGMFL
ncbi:hypothetical protein PAPHI01_1948 [Pancytospora philotis]|nr:hypothetical protein PAPHI01_1948 [Pancytospora philotis]